MNLEEFLSEIRALNIRWYLTGTDNRLIRSNPYRMVDATGKIQCNCPIVELATRKYPLRQFGNIIPWTAVTALGIKCKAGSDIMIAADQTYLDDRFTGHDAVIARLVHIRQMLLEATGLKENNG